MLSGLRFVERGAASLVLSSFRLEQSKAMEGKGSRFVWTADTLLAQWCSVCLSVCLSQSCKVVQTCKEH
jgi:hypothetical protein